MLADRFKVPTDWGTADVLYGPHRPLSSLTPADLSTGLLGMNPAPEWQCSWANAYYAGRELTLCEADEDAGSVTPSRIIELQGFYLYLYPPRDVPAGEVDLPPAGEVHDLIILVVLRGVIASHVAVAEAEHIAHGVEDLVHNRVGGREEVGEELVVPRADVRVIVRHDPPAFGSAFSVLRNIQSEAPVGGQRGAHTVVVLWVLIDHAATLVLPRAVVARGGKRGDSG